MNKDETKNATVATEQSPQSQPVAAAAAPDPTPDAGTPAAAPPADGEGCEAVTVVILASDPAHAELAARSVRHNLIGVDGDIHIVPCAGTKTDIETLMEHLPDVQTERIVLMYDNMVILQPTTIYELGCRRGRLTPKGVELGETHTPHLMHKSVLCRMLPYLKEMFPHANIMLEYDNYARPAVSPVIMREWNRDNWLLPVVSAAPSPGVIRQWARTQRFMLIETSPWPQSVLEFLNQRFPA